MEILGEQSAQREVLQLLPQDTEGCPGSPRNQGLQMLPEVSVEVDPSDPAQVSAACCPPSGCAAPGLLPGLFMSSQQANTGVTSFS